jgi:hypothetical protein
MLPLDSILVEFILKKLTLCIFKKEEREREREEEGEEEESGLKALVSPFIRILKTDPGKIGVAQ